jgi:hypothetical protein
MPTRARERFVDLDAGERGEALRVATERSGRPADLLEKDVWVVWVLAALFDAPFGEHLCFKGGTSLSKAYSAIQRFSEDLDLTYDVRSLLPRLHGDEGPEVIPANNSQAKRITDEVKEALPEWIRDDVVPALQARIDAEGVPKHEQTAGDRLSRMCIVHDRCVSCLGARRVQVMSAISEIRRLVYRRLAVEPQRLAGPPAWG